MDKNKLINDTNTVKLSGTINNIIHVGENVHKFRLRMRRGERCTYVLCMAFRAQCDTFDNFVPERYDHVTISGCIQSFKMGGYEDIPASYETGVQIFNMKKSKYIETIPASSLMSDKEPTFDDDIPF